MATTISRTLKEIEQDVKRVDSSFKAAQRSAKGLADSLKLDPTNVKLTQGYYDALRKQVDLCKDKLRLLREEQDKLVAANGDSAKTTQKYKDLELAIEQTTVKMKSLENELDKSIQKVGKFGDTAKKNFSQAQTIANGVGSAFKKILGTATALIGAVIGIGLAFANTADEIAKASKKFGVGTTEWQVLSNQWEQLTGDASAYASVLQALTAVSAQAAIESPKLQRILERLGLTFEDLQGLSLNEQLEVYLEALRSCESETERMALATKLFGTSIGPWMAEMATTGSGAIAQWNAELEEAGILTEEQIKQGEELADTFSYFKKSIQAMIAESGLELKALIESLLELAKNLIPLVTAIAKGLNAIGPAGAVAIGVFISMMSALPTLIVILNALNVAAKQYATAIISLGVLATVSALGAAALVAANSNGSTRITGTAPEYVGASQDEQEELIYQGANGAGASNTSNSKVVNYEDNETYNFSISNKMDLEEVLEEIANRKRGMIGG